MRILAKALALITFRDRYFPEFDWSDKSWTHNTFRFYEMLFGRRVGIRAESTAIMVLGEDGTKTEWVVCHSWESVFAVAETGIRAYLSSWKWVPFKIIIPVFQTPQGIPMLASPYVFAIAFDAASNTGGISNSTPFSTTQTCTGANLTLTMNFRWWSNGGSQSISSTTYNAVSLTSIATQDNESPTNYKSSAYYLVNPSTGANTGSVGFSGNSYGIMGMASFSGTNVASVLGAQAVFHSFSNVSSTSNSLVTNFANSYVVDMEGTSGGISSITAGQTANYAVGASPACAGSQRRTTTTAGSYSMGWTFSGGDQYGQVIYEIKELAASGPASVKTWDAITQSTGIKTYFANTLANTKSVLGVS